MRTMFEMLRKTLQEEAPCPDRLADQSDDDENSSKHKEGIFLVSLGSPRITPNFVRKVVERAAVGDVKLTVVFLDSLEITNLKILYALDERTAADHVEERCIKLAAQIQGGTSKHVRIFRLSEMLEDKRLDKVIARVKVASETDRRFARMCANQVFINLHPVLRRFGIKNSRHQTVLALSLIHI